MRSGCADTTADHRQAGRETTANSHTMTTTHADLAAGERTDIDIEFISRQRLEYGGRTVHRLLVADREGTQFAVLTAPDADPVMGVKTGATHRVTNLLASRPIGEGDGDGERCPDCGERLRAGRVADAIDSAVASAAADLGVEKPFGVLDGAASIRRVSTDATERVDDWAPMETPEMPRSVDAPDYVCTGCGRRVHPSELRDRRTDAQPIANESPQEVVNASASAAPSETVGLATGGAKDVTNFRENIANGYTPQPAAIDDAGLFYDYHFETGAPADSSALFAPRFATAASDHPIDGTTEQYLSVGLDSTLSVDDFERPRLDLVAVLDVSGSMNNEFDSYYHDERGTRHEVEDGATTKLAAATQSLCALTEQLHENDRLGVVLYNHRAHVAKPLRDVGATDMPAIRRHIRDIQAEGRTNLADGFEAAAEMLAADPSSDAERRVVFMTDMMPNTGTTETADLVRLFESAAADGIHTTFVGMGLDANADLTDDLSGIRGANHYFVHSAAEFERRLGEEFDYMVTPLVYDLSLALDAEGYAVEAVHGAPGEQDDPDRLISVETLFPSAKQDGDARGGVVLLRLVRTGSDPSVGLVASWTERDGRSHSERVQVSMPDETPSYEHDGIRKAVALARYARELRMWAADVHGRSNKATGVDDWLVADQHGRHEREPVPLVVPSTYAERFVGIHEYLQDELAALGDATLERELDLLETLCQQASAEEHGGTEECDEATCELGSGGPK